METRPRIKVKLSRFDKFLESLAAIFLLFMWGLTFYILLKLPSTVPIHYNALGKVDRYGDKVNLLILPIISTGLYFGMSHINKYPHIFNYMVEITADNAERQYGITTRMIRFLKLSVLIVFTYIILSTYLTAVGITNGPGFWFLPLFLFLISVPIGISIIKSLKEV